jgi:penicillin-binding protein 1A
MLPPDIPDTREQVEDPRTAYQMVSILEGVVQRGTAAKLRDLGVPLAGKTGTTNESKDAWFMGFTPDLVCGVYVGFDDPKPLGSHETGASVAVPIFKEFMAEAIKDQPVVPFRVPSGLRMVRVNPETETLASVGTKNAIWESFIPGTEPQEGQPRPILDGSVTGAASEGAAAAMSLGSATTPDALSAPAQPVLQAPVPPPVSTVPSVKTPSAPVVPAVPSSATQGTGGLY